MNEKVPDDETESDLVEDSQEQYPCCDSRGIRGYGCEYRRQAGGLDVVGLEDVWQSRCIMLVGL